jgi:hypothetical protein
MGLCLVDTSQIPIFVFLLVTYLHPSSLAEQRKESPNLISTVLQYGTVQCSTYSQWSTSEACRACHASTALLYRYCSYCQTVLVASLRCHAGLAVAGPLSVAIGQGDWPYSRQ